MKRLMLTALVLLLPALALAADMGVSHDHDLDALWAQARTTFDLDVEDAVVLLESRAFTHADDTLTETVHRVVWIRTAVGIRSYADLRVPWNSADSALDVEILRTWREGRWWPDAEKISDTAVVHTLPHALDRADDYTTMRETMLLHDGVELGCIMETRYTITSTGRPGAGGVFVFPQRDPAVRVDLSFTAQAGKFTKMNGAPAPVMTGTTQFWRMENLPALKLPLTDDPALYEPAAAWTTWNRWEDAGDAWEAAVTAAAELKPEQVEAFKTEIAGQTGLVSRLEAVAGYLNDMTRGIHYPDRFWAFTPRPAWRTLETAYGHTLDRAVLAATLLHEAGFEMSPILLGQGHRLVAEGMPRLTDFRTPAFLIVESNGLVFLPESGTVTDLNDLASRPMWKLGQKPRSLPPVSGDGTDRSSAVVTLTLEPGDEGWTGSMWMAASGPVTPYAGVLTASDFAAGPATHLLGSLLPAAEVTATRPEYLTPAFTEVRVDFTLPAPEDGKLVLGPATGGLLDRLPPGVHLYDQVRESPVIGLGGFHQTVVLRVKTDGAGPAPVTLENAAGRFSLDVMDDGDWLVVTRDIRITADPVPAADWPALRELLLTEDDPAHGRVKLD